MEAKELRIGNLVQCNIDEMGIVTVITNTTKYINGIDLKHLQPIPLTEEILLKCGLKRTLYDSSYELNDFSIFLDKRIRENIYIKCEKRNWNVLNGLRIDYLHQLQNLYFALTNEELTVNL